MDIAYISPVKHNVIVRVNHENVGKSGSTIANNEENIKNLKEGSHIDRCEPCFAKTEILYYLEEKTVEVSNIFCKICYPSTVFLTMLFSQSHEKSRSDLWLYQRPTDLWYAGKKHSTFNSTVFTSDSITKTFTFFVPRMQIIQHMKNKTSIRIPMSDTCWAYGRNATPPKNTVTSFCANFTLTLSPNSKLLFTPQNQAPEEKSQPQPKKQQQITSPRFYKSQRSMAQARVARHGLEESIQDIEDPMKGNIVIEPTNNGDDIFLKIIFVFITGFFLVFISIGIIIALYKAKRRALYSKMATMNI